MSFIIYTLIVVNNPLYHDADSMSNVILRVLAGISGVVFVGMACLNVNKDSKIISFIVNIGKYTLEIYYCHMLYITMNFEKIETFRAYTGVFAVTVVAGALAALTYITYKVLSVNDFFSFVFFGKTARKK